LFGESKTEDLELPLTEFEAVIMATDNFSDSNILGRGGFGIVYKVKLTKHYKDTYIYLWGILFI